MFLLGQRLSLVYFLELCRRMVLSGMVLGGKMGVHSLVLGRKLGVPGVVLGGKVGLHRISMDREMAVCVMEYYYYLDMRKRSQRRAVISLNRRNYSHERK